MNDDYQWVQKRIAGNNSEIERLVDSASSFYNPNTSERREHKMYTLKFSMRDIDFNFHSPSMDLLADTVKMVINYFKIVDAEKTKAFVPNPTVFSLN